MWIVVNVTANEFFQVDENDTEGKRVRLTTLTLPEFTQKDTRILHGINSNTVESNDSNPPSLLTHDISARWRRTDRIVQLKFSEGMYEFLNRVKNMNEIQFEF